MVLGNPLITQKKTTKLSPLLGNCGPSGPIVAISASGGKSSEDTDYARNAQHGQGTSRRRRTAARILDQAGLFGARRLWIPDSNAWRAPRR